MIVIPPFQILGGIMSTITVARSGYADRARTICFALALLAVFALLQLPRWSASASDCSKTSVGFVPLSDLGHGRYQGKEGGLYPGGSNVRPELHEEAGVAIARGIHPLNNFGQPDVNGRVVLLSIGMSNTTQEFSAFMPLASADPGRNPTLVIVDGAQGGMPANKIADLSTPPAQQFWSTVDQRLQAAGVVPAQVQVAWIKQADSTPADPFPSHALKLKDELGQIVRILKDRFPNITMAYLSSRTYAGYATTALNPEPYAYESGFSVKWLIEDQINGVFELNYDSTRGPVEAPWLSWGPYLWADGMRPRSDGLTYNCLDFVEDGTHPAPGGARDKVAAMLLGFLKTDSTARLWYLKDEADFTAPSVRVLAPNGKERFRPGALVNVQWDASDDKGIASQNILLSLDKGLTFPITLAAAVPAGARSSDVSLPAGISTKKARIRVAVRDLSGNESHDDSDKNFKIRP